MCSHRFAGWPIVLLMALLSATLSPLIAADSLLWLENDRVQQVWEGENLSRVIDEETAYPCLEWHQDPATRGTARLILKGVDPSRYDAIRLQWKHLGGGAGISVTVGKRNYYLFKDLYRPDVWRDTWLDLALDDDQGGPLLQPDGSLEILLRFYNLPQNRPGEQAWRRLRVRDLCLIKFPVRLDCDPTQVACEADDAELRTVFPMRLANATDREQLVELLLDPAPLRDFSASFAQNEISVPPGATVTVPLTFTIAAAKAAAHEPLYIEEAPVYARVKGDPDSLTTWYRGYVQWKPGGVIPPRRVAAPLMVDHAIRQRVQTMVDAYPWAKQAHDRMLDVKDALERPIVVPELRHGYSGHNICPEHQKPVKYDLVEFKRHWCEAGQHHVEGVATLDRAAALTIHTRNSDDCAHLGWAYFLTGDDRAARKAADLLLAYAAVYPEWSVARPGATGYGSRVAHAVLGECWWIHGFVDGYDLIAASPVISVAEHTAIRQRLFAVASDSIQSHRVEKNQQCEINWASGGAAVNARAWYLAALRFSGSYGLRDMIELSFSEEGFSRENEFPYHYSAMLPIVDQGVAWEALGARFFDNRVKRIFDAPLAFSLDQRLGWSGVYEIGYRYYGDPSYLSQLTRDRPSRQALLYGVAPLPEQAAGGVLTNSNLPLAGKSTLRCGTPDLLRAMQISWGAPTYRGGQDMLNFLASFHGIGLNRSVTRIGYGYQVHGLSYQTLAGNLVQVDGLDQTGVRPRQVAIVDGDLPAAQFQAPPTAPLYPGVRQSRVCAIAGDTFVVIDRLAADRERRFDLSFYPAADQVTVTPALTFADYPALATEGSGYAALVEAGIAPCPTGIVLDFMAGDKKRQAPARLHVLLDSPGQLIQSKTYTNWHPFLTPLYLFRRQADAFTAISVLEAGDKELPVASVERLPVTLDGRELPPPQGIAVRVTLRDGRVYLIIDSDAGLTGQRQAASQTTDQSLWTGLVK